MVQSMLMHRRVIGTLVLGTILFTIPVAHAQNARPAPLRTIGIVEIPAVMNRISPEGTLLPPERPVDIRARPELRSQVVAAVTSGATLEAKEYGYEELGALVFARQRGWSLVKTTEGVTGWLGPSDGGPFHSLESLLKDGLTYLTEAWDGFLSREPNGNRVRPTLKTNARRDETEDVSVRVIGFRTVGGALWVNLELMSESGCTGGTPVVRGRGWVPAHAASGEPTVWFYSRGC